MVWKVYYFPWLSLQILAQNCLCIHAPQNWPFMPHKLSTYFCPTILTICSCPKWNWLLIPAPQNYKKITIHSYPTKLLIPASQNWSSIPVPKNWTSIHAPQHWTSIHVLQKWSSIPFPAPQNWRPLIPHKNWPPVHASQKVTIYSCPTNQPFLSQNREMAAGYLQSSRSVHPAVDVGQRHHAPALLKSQSDTDTLCLHSMSHKDGFIFMHAPVSLWCTNF